MYQKPAFFYTFYREKKWFFYTKFSCFRLVSLCEMFENILIRCSFSRCIEWAYFQTLYIIILMRNCWIYWKIGDFFLYKKLRIFRSILQILSQKYDLKNFKNRQFCRARRALSNHIKISKKKILVNFCIWCTLPRIQERQY